jgi:hypothetical protein
VGAAEAHVAGAVGMTILCIIPGPRYVIRRAFEPARWCFGERKRRMGMHVLLGDREPSYYEPIWVYRCDGCGEDRRWMG